MKFLKIVVLIFAIALASKGVAQKKKGYFKNQNL